MTTFYHASSCSRGIGDRSNSVRPSVCHTATRVFCDKTKKHRSDILIPYKSVITSFLAPRDVGGRRPLPLEIRGQSDPSL